jgi:hypothetical protein
MSWDDPALHPAHRHFAHPNGATGFARLDVTVPDEQAAVDWLGGAVPTTVNLRTASGSGTAVGPAFLDVWTPAGDVRFDS